MNNMELIRAKVTVALDALRTKKVELEKKLYEMVGSNAAAYAVYGSETCIGGMIAEERGVSMQIHKLQEKIDVLEAFLRGEIELDAREALVEELNAADEKIAELKKTKEEMRRHIARIDLVLAYTKADFQPIAI